MTGIEKKRRAADMRGVGISLGAAGLVVMLVESGKLRQALLLSAAGALCYYTGLKWE